MSTRYITTETNPFLKEGIEIQLNNELVTESIIHFEGPVIEYGNMDFESQLDKGYIKELQEPEFTKDDMIDFCTLFADGALINSGVYSHVDYQKAFKEWKDNYHAIK